MGGTELAEDSGFWSFDERIDIMHLLCDPCLQVVVFHLLAGKLGLRTAFCR